jgi:hypothetical protein
MFYIAPQWTLTNGDSRCAAAALTCYDCLCDKKDCTECEVEGKKHKHRRTLSVISESSTHIRACRCLALTRHYANR